MKYVLHGYESANPQLWLHEIKQYTCKAHCIKTNRKRGIMLTSNSIWVDIKNTKKENRRNKRNRTK